jgi:hypothetical protein
VRNGEWEGESASRDPCSVSLIPRSAIRVPNSSPSHGDGAEVGARRSERGSRSSEMILVPKLHLGTESLFWKLCFPHCGADGIPFPKLSSFAFPITTHHGGQALGTRNGRA